jgi:hypothetical protein
MLAPHHCSSGNTLVMWSPQTRHLVFWLEKTIARRRVVWTLNATPLFVTATRHGFCVLTSATSIALFSPSDASLIRQWTLPRELTALELLCGATTFFFFCGAVGC